MRDVCVMKHIYFLKGDTKMSTIKIDNILEELRQEELHTLMSYEETENSKHFQSIADTKRGGMFIPEYEQPFQLKRMKNKKRAYQLSHMIDKTFELSNLSIDELQSLYEQTEDEYTTLIKRFDKNVGTWKRQKVVKDENGKKVYPLVKKNREKLSMKQAELELLQKVAKLNNVQIFVRIDTRNIRR